MKRTATLLACLLPLLAVATPAQEPASTTAATPAAKPATFKLAAGEVSVTDLIDRCATFLGFNILSNPGELQGATAIRLQQAIEVDREGCLDLLSNMLYRSGLVVTVLDEQLGMYEVILMAGQRGREIVTRAQRRTADEVLAAPRRKMPVTVVVPLHNINATNALRPFFAAAGGNGGSLTLGNVGNNASLLLSGMQDQVAQAILMLRTCDTASGESQESDELAKRVDAIEKRIAELEKQLAARTAKEN